MLARYPDFKRRSPIQRQVAKVNRESTLHKEESSKKDSLLDSSWHFKTSRYRRGSSKVIGY